MTPCRKTDACALSPYSLTDRSIFYILIAKTILNHSFKKYEKVVVPSANYLLYDDLVTKGHSLVCAGAEGNLW